MRPPLRTCLRISKRVKEDPDMKKINLKNAMALFGMLSAMLILNSCAETKVLVQEEKAAKLVNESIMLITPVAMKQNLEKECIRLGSSFQVEIKKRVKGAVIYSYDVPGLRPLSTWDNMVKNGEINKSEAASMAKSIGCSSVVTVRVLEYKQYPPFKMVIEMLWIDSDTGNLIGSLYNDVDVTDSAINYRYRCFSGQGPVKELYEEFAYSEDVFHTASLSPDSFKTFAAAFCSVVMFENAGKIPWWYFWRTI